MEIFALTPKGAVVSKSTNGVTDPNHKDFAKWKILYALYRLHYCDKEKLISVTGLNPVACSLALTNLKMHGYVVDTSNTGG